MVILLRHLGLLVIVLVHLELLLQANLACLQTLGNKSGRGRLSIMSLRWNLVARIIVTCLRDLCELGCPCTGNKNGLLLPNSTSDQGKSSLHLPATCDQPYLCLAHRDALLSIRMCADNSKVSKWRPEWQRFNAQRRSKTRSLIYTAPAALPTVSQSFITLQNCNTSGIAYQTRSSYKG